MEAVWLCVKSLCIPVLNSGGGGVEQEARGERQGECRHTPAQASVSRDYTTTAARRSFALLKVRRWCSKMQKKTSFFFLENDLYFRILGGENATQGKF